MFKNKSILITGGTGSFGKAFIASILKKKYSFRRIIIFSRDELKQYEMKTSATFNEKKNKNLRYFIGDVRDKNRLLRAFDDVDYVIHAAALKQVPTAEYNPFETINTNIIGAQNVIDAAISTNVKKVIALSTDKASSPINLYGATKLCSDKLFIAANNFLGKKKITFSVVRYGNVMGSRGSVIPLFIKQAKNGKLKITDKNMTRFNITLDDSINLVKWSLGNSFGAEIVVPKIPSYRIMDLAKSICKKCKIEIIGKRNGEKLHEEMISFEESLNVISINNYFIILQQGNNKQLNYYSKRFKVKKFKKQFSYSSGKNEEFLKISQLESLIQKSQKNNIF
ncbi:UDP-N-acetylglucosamine 4,6-dehydratase (inverting) [Candidatus Pelagibacter sp.]|nr:UDP-N-acetylglucosamine 4,6-dehydratase (inverting) [Candidatus Pelagibacter sp.]